MSKSFDTPRNAPATAVPWRDLSPATAMQRAHVRDRNVAYAVHAVNAYPKLLAALRAAISNVEILHDASEENTDNPTAKTIGRDLRAAQALLKELGEGK